MTTENAILTTPDPVAYVRFNRKTQPRDYESAEASVSIPVPIPEGGIGDVEFANACDDAMNLAAATVYDTLKVEYEVTEAGRIVEVSQPAPTIKAAGVAPAPAAAIGNVERAFGPVGNSGDGTACGVCGGPVWDNRTSKTNPKAPDYKCRDKECGAAAWLTPQGTIGKWKK